MNPFKQQINKHKTKCQVWRGYRVEERLHWGNMCARAQGVGMTYHRFLKHAKPGFLNLSTTDLWNSLLWGAVMCMAGSLAASLGSTQ